jgi:16S rRNA (guanine527-N7)-methyltransferase
VSRIVERLAAGAQRLGISLNEDQLGRFRIYYETLIEWNRRLNLTRITDYEEVQVKHFLDSLSCWLAIERLPGVPADLAGIDLQTVDVGSGAGFPGVALKLILPSLRLTLLEATGKKADFLEFLVQRLELSQVRVIKARAEELGQDAAHRERYDLALARAVAGMATLAELTLPLVRIGGWVIAHKGDEPVAETETAQNAIVTLGGQVQEILPVRVPGLEATRHLVVLEKVISTPVKYPRRPGMPAKRPLV